MKPDVKPRGNIKLEKIRLERERAAADEKDDDEEREKVGMRVRPVGPRVATAWPSRGNYVFIIT